MAEKEDPNRITKIKDSLKSALNYGEKDESLSEREFYKEVDKTKSKSNCSLTLIIIILVVIFALIVLALITIKNYTKTGIDFVAKNNSQNQLTLSQNFLDQIKNISPGETKTIDFSDIDVAGYLGIADQDFPLKQARLIIADQGIIVTGRTSNSIFSLPVKLVIKPEIIDGRFTLMIDQIATGSISLPQPIRNSVNDYLSLIIRSKNLNDPNIELISTQTFDRTLRFEVRAK